MLRYLYQIAKKMLLIQIRKVIAANGLEGKVGLIQDRPTVMCLQPGKQEEVLNKIS